MVVEQTNPGERVYDIFSRLLKDSIVFIGPSIDDTVANLVIAQMLLLEADDPDMDVLLYINSPAWRHRRGPRRYTKVTAPLCCSLRHEQRHNRGRIPELHRPSRRSSRSARTPDAPFLNRGGLVANKSFAALRRAGRTMPSRTRRASRLSLSGRSALTGSSRATGRRGPRSELMNRP